MRRWTMGALGAALGAAIGFLAGATIGGNLADDVRFAGARGYEATGQIGAIAGAILGAGAALVLATRRAAPRDTPGSPGR